MNITLLDLLRFAANESQSLKLALQQLPLIITVLMDIIYISKNKCSSVPLYINPWKNQSYHVLVLVSIKNGIMIIILHIPNFCDVNVFLPENLLFLTQSL